MTVEKNVLAALGQVKKYKQLGKENMALCGSSNRPLIVLQKKEASSKLSDLNGRWIISEAGGQAIPSGMEKQPAIEFDIAEKRMHGNPWNLRLIKETNSKCFLFLHIPFFSQSGTYAA